MKTTVKTTPTTNSGTTKSAGKPRRYRSLFRRQKGQSALEFLLVLPIFVVFFLLVVDLGMLMYQYVSISNAVREGARFGAVTCGDGSCEDDGLSETVPQRTAARSSGILDLAVAPGEVQVGWLDNNVPPNGPQNRGDSVVVRVVHDYNFMFFPGSIEVISCADMSLEQGDPAPLGFPGKQCHRWRLGINSIGAPHSLRICFPAKAVARPQHKACCR